MHALVTESADPLRLAREAVVVWEHMRTEGTVVSTYDSGEPHIVEINLRDAVNAKYPQHFVKGSGGSRHALEFQTGISVYLKYSGNATLIRKASHGVLSKWQMAETWTDVPDDIVLNRSRHRSQHAGAQSANPMRRVMSAAPEITIPADPDLCPAGCPGRREWNEGERQVTGHRWHDRGRGGYLAHVPEGAENDLPPHAPDQVDPSDESADALLGAVAAVHTLLNDRDSLRAQVRRLEAERDAAYAERDKALVNLGNLKTALDLVKEAIAACES